MVDSNIILAEEIQDYIKMGKHCLIPSYNPNYRSRTDGSIIGRKTPVFRFPADEQECSTWLKAIPLKKEINAKTSVLCERHWPTGYHTISKKGKLRPQDPPSLWPEHPNILPPSCIPKPPPKPRPTKRASFEVRGMQADELLLFLEFDRVNIEDISERVCSNSELFCCPTTAYKDDELLVIQSKARSQGIPRFMVEIQQDLKFTAFHMGIKVRLVNYINIYIVYIIYIYDYRIYQVVDSMHRATFLSYLPTCSLHFS